jgi:hypothetical protein
LRKHQKFKEQRKMQKISFLNKVETRWKGNRKTGRNGNVARDKSSSSPICYMIGTEVYTSVDITS